MEVILLQDVEKIGRKGKIVRVKDGYGRNFLLPRGLALVSTAANRKFVEELRVRAEKRYAQEKEKAEQQAGKMKDLKLQAEAAAGEQGKLFGSVTADNIRELLEEKGHKFEKKQIHLKEPIRSLGIHEVTVELYPQVKVVVPVEVVPKS